MSENQWTAERIALLGTDTDGNIAKRLEVSPDDVRQARRGLQIKPFKERPQKKWTPTEIALLGKMSDPEVAQITGREPAAVTAARRHYKIPGAKNGRPRVKWTDEAIALLGVESDKSIAEILECSVQSVINKRVSLGIRNRKKRTQRNKANILPWVDVQGLPQHEFLSAIRGVLSEHWKRKVSYPDIARVTLYSLSRIQKWGTAGSAQEPLNMTVRHHIWCAAQLALLDHEDISAKA